MKDELDWLRAIAIAPKSFGFTGSRVFRMGKSSELEVEEEIGLQLNMQWVSSDSELKLGLGKMKG